MTRDPYDTDRRPLPDAAELAAWNAANKRARNVIGRGPGTSPQCDMCARFVPSREIRADGLCGKCRKKEKH